tara:strand:+ start:14 stop:1255 length:1242 start_codon:yes stop_codon:yes gene_type:complete
MGTNYNPQIVTSGLVLALDAANPKSYSYAENLISNTNMDLPLYWTKINIGANTSNAAIAPDGSNTALSLIPAAVPSSETEITTSAGSAVANTAYTFSVYAKANGYNYIRLSFGNTAGWGVAFFNLSTGTIGTTTSANLIPRIVSSSNGWYRCSITYTAGRSGSINGDLYITNNDNTYGWTPNGTSGVLLWGPQIESNLITGRYTPTTGTRIVSSNVWSDLSATKSNITFTKRSPYDSNSSGYFYFNPSANADNSLTISPALTANTANGFSIGMWLHESYIQYNSTWNYFLVDYPYEIGTYGVTGTVFVLKDNNIVGLNSVASETISGGWSYIVYGTDNNLMPYIYTCNQNGITLTKNNVAFTSKILNISKLFEGYDNTYSFSANCSIVQIYNRAISNTEVQQNFNATRGRYGI